MPDDIFQSFAAHRELILPTEQTCRESLERLGTLMATALRSEGKVLFLGNGGSAADAQHLAAEFTIRFIKNRRALAAIALTVDCSSMTACGNDLGFDQIFSRQIEALGRSGDVAIGISTSGNSPNINGALERARSQGLTAAAFSGHDGGNCAELPILWSWSPLARPPGFRKCTSCWGIFYARKSSSNWD